MTTSAEGAPGAVTKAPPLWGDGLLDRSLASQWYPGTWDEVDLDELTFFMPGLTRHTAPAQGGLASHLRAALARRVGVTLPRLAGYLKLDAVRDRKRLLELIEECAGLPPLDLRDAVAAAGTSTPASGVHTRALRPLSAEERLDAVVYEVSVLNCLGRMLQDCSQESFETRVGTNARQPFAEADALIATIHSGINAAYVYPQFAYAHETFAAGAWLGVLLTGRRALLPEMIAARLSEAVSAGGVQDASGVVLSYHAHIAVGHRRMSRLAHRAQRRSRPPAVRARRPLFGVAKRPWVWNDELCSAVARRLSPYVQSPVHLREERTCNVISAP